MTTTVLFLMMALISLSTRSHNRSQSQHTNSTNPRKTQTDEVAGHHQSPICNMQDRAAKSRQAALPFHLALVSRRREMVACANPAVCIFLRTEDANTAHGQTRRSAEEEERGGVSNVQGGGVAALKATSTW